MIHNIKGKTSYTGHLKKKKKKTYFKVSNVSPSDCHVDTSLIPDLQKKKAPLHQTSRVYI